MKNPLLPLALTALLWTGCGSVPLTGRRQLLLVSDQEVLTSSLTQYNDYMKTAPRSSSAKQAAMVKRVGQKIAQATETYLRQNGLAAEVKNFQWEFNLVADDQVNAFCMPGGKIVVYEGLMKLVTSDDELAVVIGHEVAHAVAKHSNERLSQQMLAQTGAQLLNYSLAEKSAAIQTAASTIYGLGAQVGVMLPFSRKHETEADYMPSASGRRCRPRAAAPSPNCSARTPATPAASATSGRRCRRLKRNIEISDFRNVGTHHGASVFHFAVRGIRTHRSTKKGAEAPFLMEN